MSRARAEALEVLGLGPGATRAQVKRAFRRLVKRWHPDRYRRRPHQMAQAEARFKEIVAAFDVLEAIQESPLAGSGRGPVADGPMPNQAKAHRPPDPPSERPRPRRPGLLRQLRRHARRATRRLRRWGRAHGVTALAWASMLLVFAGLALALLGLGEADRVPGLSSRAQAPGMPGAEASHRERGRPPAGPAASELGAGSPVAEGSIGAGEPVAPRWFTLGSSEVEVLALEGPPQLRAPSHWQWGLRWVSFRAGRVVGWGGPGLAARLTRSVPSTKEPAWFTVGSTKDTVLAVQGCPDSVLSNSWHWGLSWVIFRGDRVVGWSGPGLRARPPEARPADPADQRPEPSPAAR